VVCSLAAVQPNTLLCQRDRVSFDQALGPSAL